MKVPIIDLSTNLFLTKNSHYYRTSFRFLAGKFMACNSGLSSSSGDKTRDENESMARSVKIKPQLIPKRKCFTQVQVSRRNARYNSGMTGVGKQYESILGSKDVALVVGSRFQGCNIF